jgi:hypothetical protein
MRISASSQRHRRILPGMSSTRLARVAALAVVIGVGGTACSSSSGSAAAPAGTTTSATSSSGTSASGAAGGAQTPVPVESNPPGDIPDNLAFVRYTNAAAGYSFTHPEGWAEQENGVAVTFTDKLNGITADTASIPSQLDPATVRAQEVPRLSAAEAAFELVSVDPASLPAGKGVLVVYRRNSAPDPVTGRQVRAEVQEYLVSTGTSSVRLALFGPVGADNVDAYHTIAQSLTLR